jgi:hypothetical protein
MQQEAKRISGMDCGYDSQTPFSGEAHASIPELYLMLGNGNSNQREDENQSKGRAAA